MFDWTNDGKLSSISHVVLLPLYLQLILFLLSDININNIHNIITSSLFFCDTNVLPQQFPSENLKYNFYY